MVNFESSIESAKRFSKIWWQSRADAGKSQEHMALGLGVSKKTIQNWEKGTSSPTLFQSCKWFQLIGLNPFHYYLEYLYPSAFPNNGADEDVDKALNYLIGNMTQLEKKELIYLISGNHGSSWLALLQLFTAHCHTSIHSRVLVAKLIKESYELEKADGSLVCPSDVLPDEEILNKAIQEARKAVLKGATGYTIQFSGPSEPIDS